MCGVHAIETSNPSPGYCCCCCCYFYSCFDLAALVLNQLNAIPVKICSLNRIPVDVYQRSFELHFTLLNPRRLSHPHSPLAHLFIHSVFTLSLHFLHSESPCDTVCPNKKINISNDVKFIIFCIAKKYVLLLSQQMPILDGCSATFSICFLS